VAVVELVDVVELVTVLVAATTSGVALGTFGFGCLAVFTTGTSTFVLTTGVVSVTSVLDLLCLGGILLYYINMFSFYIVLTLKYIIVIEYGLK
jgi:hypothetical protein